MQNLKERSAWALKIIKKDPTLDEDIRDCDLAKKLHISENTLAQYRKGAGVLKSIVVEELISTYHFSPTWLFRGEGEPFPGARSKYPEVCGPEEYKVHVIDTPSHGEAAEDDGEFLFVPQVSDKISAGFGLEPYNHVEMRIAFRKDWLQKKGNPKNMNLIRVDGDSMEPTLMSSDLVLVDHGRNFIGPQGGIYAITLDSMIMIKRLQVMPLVNKVSIISDNDRYRSIDADIAQVKVNGKVIWFGRNLEA